MSNPYQSPDSNNLNSQDPAPRSGYDLKHKEMYNVLLASICFVCLTGYQFTYDNFLNSGACMVEATSWIVQNALIIGSGTAMLCASGLILWDRFIDKLFTERFGPAVLFSHLLVTLCIVILSKILFMLIMNAITDAIYHYQFNIQTLVLAMVHSVIPGFVIAVLHRSCMHIFYTRHSEVEISRK